MFTFHTAFEAGDPGTMISTVQKNSKAATNSLSAEEFFLQILYQDDAGWKLRLPAELRAHQGELEELLDKVFANRGHSVENFALAQQLAVNWCFSKCRQTGIAVEDCLASA
jgi:hypothetical protein